MSNDNGLKEKLIIDFWKSKLRKKPQNILEPFRSSKGEKDSFATYCVPFPNGIDEKISKLSNRQPLLKYIYYSTAFSILLHRYTNVKRIHLGGPVIRQNDTIDEIQSVNFYEFSIEKHYTFKDLFSKNKQEVLHVMKYQGLGFERLQSHLSDDVLNWSDVFFSDDAIQLHDFEPDRFKVKFKIKRHNQQIELVINSDSDAFDAQILEYFSHNFFHLLHQLIEDPYKPILSYSVMSEKECEMLYSNFNNTKRSLEGSKSIVEMLEHHAIKIPKKIAVFCGDQKLTYKQLNDKVNQTACLFAERNVQPDDIVTVIMDRSIDMIIALMAIWKCGGTYLALDPILPKNRIDKIIGKSNPKLIVYAEEHKTIFDQDEFGEIAMVFDQSLLENQDDEKPNPNIPIKDNDGAYLIYTSGSTGEPKGVLVEHIGMVNHMLAFIDELGLDEKSVVAQNASPNFDISVWQFFTAFFVGGSTVIISQKLIANTAEFVEEIIDKKVTILEVVPSYLFLLLDQFQMHPEVKLDHLKYLMVTGESIKPPLVNNWLSLFPNVPVVNAYGPTEASDDITLYFIDKPTKLEAIPIGHVLQNLHIYIVDDQGKLCPIGVKGEIVVSGIGIARGYLNDIEKTINVFGFDPFREQKGVKMYKTGDVGRYLPNGDIQFFGRKDYQVKIQGYRIELEEIETLFSSINGIKEVVVKDWVGKDDGKFLTAYITWEEKTKYSNEELKRQLKEMLPVYMIPSVIVTLDKMPLLDNGKINRKQLSKPASHTIGQSNYLPDTNVNKVQLKVKEIWEEILGKPHIGLNDDFFRLGGHSLLVIKAIGRMEKEFNTKLDAAELFFNPTVASYAKLIETSYDDSSFTAIEALEECDYYNLSHAQRRLWVLDKMGADTAYNISNAFHIEGKLSIEKLTNAFQTLIQKFDILRTVFIEVNGVPKQKIIDASVFQFDLGYQDFSKNTSVDELIERERVEAANTEFMLDEGPLFHVKLLKVDVDKSILLLSMHHIISDGLSLNNMISTISDYYMDPTLQGEKKADRPSIQYRDFAIWQNNELNTEHAAQQLTNFRQLFQGKLPVLQLPWKSGRPPIKTYKGKSKTHTFGDPVNASIVKISQENDVTFFMVLISWVKLLLFRYSDQTDIIIGSSIMGRDQEALENQIGLFLNSIAIRTKFQKSDSYLDFLGQVKTAVLEAYKYKSYPFDKLIDDLKLERDLSRSPLFDVMIDMQESSDLEGASNVAASGLNVVALPSSVNTSRFDLQFSFLRNENNLQLGINYNSDLFSDASIDLLFDHLNRLILSISKKPSKGIQNLTMLSNEEVLVNQLSQGGQQHQERLEFLFEKQVARFPERKALVSEGKSLTYAELDHLSNQFAAYLLDNLRVKPNEIIGVLMERSEWVFVSILGILKSGAAFLPIDLKNPADRIEFILEDAGVKSIITDSRSMFNVPTSFDGNIFAVDIQLEEAKDELIKVKVQKKQSGLAYVIYTSGTTGKPKGVCISHSSIVNYVTWANNYYFNNRPNNPFAVFTSLAFDLTLTSILTTIARGDTAHIFPEQDIKLTLQYIFDKDSKVKVVKLTPSHVDLLPFLNLDESSIQTAILGGEPLVKRQVDVLLKLNPEMAIFNEYGPTESTIGCTVKKVNRPENISIGKPILNTNICILNDAFNIQPIGVRGQIAIGGIGLSDGYLNREKLNKEKFISNPFSKNERLYLTGDIGYISQDYEIKYIGRRDQQIKLMGYRIEKEEIENVLRGVPGVNQVLVMLNENPEGDQQLVAYLGGSNALDIEDIKQFLSKKLPTYMHPSKYVCLATFPLTKNGKIDVAALKKTHIKEDKSNYIAPNTDLEKSLVEIWEQILSKENIGVKDNFFHLGGNSLKGIQLLARLDLPAEVGLKDLFQNPTIQQFAQEIELSNWIISENNSESLKNTNSKKIVI